MDGAIIGISAGGTCSDGKFLVCVQRPRFRKLFLDADNRVRFLVPVDPGDLLSGSHGDDLRIEVEILNHDLVRSGTVRTLRVTKLRVSRIRTVLFLMISVCIGSDLLAEVGVDDGERGLAPDIIDAC